MQAKPLNCTVLLELLRPSSVFSADANNIERGLTNSEYLAKTEFNNCFIIHFGMFGMRNFRYRYTGKIIPILSVYRLLERKIPYPSNLKEF